MERAHTKNLRQIPRRFAVGGFAFFWLITAPLLAFAQPWIGVTVFISPQNSPAPVYDADFQIFVDSALFYPVQFPIRYLIDCRNDGSWEADVNSYMNPYFAYDACDYTAAGVYPARVEARSGNLSASGVFNITVIPGGSTLPSPSPSLPIPSPTSSPAAAGLSVSHLAADPSSGPNFAYYENLYITPGKSAEFEIRAKNHNSSPAQNVIVSSVLPSEFSYIIGSTKVDNIAANDGVTSGGIRLGLMVPNQIKVIKFRAMLAGSDQFPQNPAKFSITAQARSDNFVPVSDAVMVWVVKPTATPAVTPTVAPEDSKGKVLGAAAVDTGNGAPWFPALVLAAAGALLASAYRVGQRLYWRKRLAA